MVTISFWQQVDSSTVWTFVIILIILALSFWLAFRFRERSESKKQDVAFYRLIEQLHLSAEEENRITGLVERQQINRPVRILKTLKEYDAVVEREIRRLLVSKEPWASKLKTFDKFYSIRDKILEYESTRG